MSGGIAAGHCAVTGAGASVALMLRGIFENSAHPLDQVPAQRLDEAQRASANVRMTFSNRKSKIENPVAFVLAPLTPIANRQSRIPMWSSIAAHRIRDY